MMDDKDIGELLRGQNYNPDQAWVVITELIHKLVEERANKYKVPEVMGGIKRKDQITYACRDFGIDPESFT